MNKRRSITERSCRRKVWLNKPATAQRPRIWYLERTWYVGPESGPSRWGTEATSSYISMDGFRNTPPSTNECHPRTTFMKFGKWFAHVDLEADRCDSVMDETTRNLEGSKPMGVY